MRTLLIGLYTFLCSACLGCGDEFASPSLVENLRLLAVQADTPFAQPGQEVHLSALAHDPEQRTLTWAWGLCFNDDSSLALDCLRATSFESLTIAENRPEHTVVMPAVAMSYVGVVVMVCPGRIERGDTFGVPLACVDANGVRLAPEDYELGVKRIYVRNNAQNGNPTIAEVRWDGAPWPAEEIKVSACTETKDMRCVGWTKHALELRAPGAEEDSFDRQGNFFHEQAVVQLYATGGEYEHDLRSIGTARTTWKARSEDSGELITLWFVVRDDRGGVSWTTRRVRVP